VLDQAREDGWQNLTAGRMTLRGACPCSISASAEARGIAHSDGDPTTQPLPPATTAASAMAAPNAIPPMEGTDSVHADPNSVSSPTHDGALASPMDEATPTSPDQGSAPPNAQTQQRVQDMLHSDVGVSTLLNRLKASIASARVSGHEAGLLCIPTANTLGRTLPAFSNAGELSRKSTPAASRN